MIFLFVQSAIRETGICQPAKSPFLFRGGVTNSLYGQEASGDGWRAIYNRTGVKDVKEFIPAALLGTFGDILYTSDKIKYE